MFELQMYKDCSLMNKRLRYGCVCHTNISSGRMNRCVYTRIRIHVYESWNFFSAAMPYEVYIGHPGSPTAPQPRCCCPCSILSIKDGCTGATPLKYSLPYLGHQCVPSWVLLGLSRHLPLRSACLGGSAKGRFSSSPFQKHTLTGDTQSKKRRVVTLISTS